MVYEQISGLEDRVKHRDRGAVAVKGAIPNWIVQGMRWFFMKLYTDLPAKDMCDTHFMVIDNRGEMISRE